jgi:hypothetical protein
VDLHIGKAGIGVYSQYGLTFEVPVLLSILREQRASKSYAIWSWILSETGYQASTWGTTYLGFALISILQEYASAVPFAIDVKERQFNLAMGISLTVGSISCAIVSAVIRKIGIGKYNEALPKIDAPAPREQQNIIEEKPQAVPDSSGTGSIESK